ncbi:MAG: SRPBCC domain-containing protein [Sphingobacteriales bacterium]|nr:MAG: SRPBCC domain-containing protein [Sphingobacteriales bacterium]
MANIIHRIGIRASSAKVYWQQMDGLANWWTDDVKGNEQLGGHIEFTFASQTGEVKGKMVMQVKELDKDKRVSWHCIDGPAEWIGTDLVFNLYKQDGQTTLLFSHRNWEEEVEFMAHCSMKWAVFLLSLRSYVEAGKGQPTPHDLKIDNWD